MATTTTTRREIPLTLTEWNALAVLEGPQRPTLVTRDGVTLAQVGTEGEAYAWLQRHQGQSVDWAIRYEGYRVVRPTRF